MRRRGRVAEGGGLLNRYTLQRRIQGSNPCVSARFSGSESLALWRCPEINPQRFRQGGIGCAYPPIGPLMAPPGGGVERQFVSKLSHRIGGNPLKIKPYSSRFGTAKKTCFGSFTSACFLRNTCPKSAAKTCGNGASLLPRGVLPLM